MNTLFDVEEEKYDFKPLAYKMRPQTLDEFFGQEDVVGPNSAIRKMIESDSITSMIFFGPPGVGKTTLAKIIAHETSSAFYEVSAVTSGVNDIKKIVETARLNQFNNRKTIVFVDEIHRFNKAQQDAFLPHVESGLIILIGATTENPSFEVNSALLSRCKVYALHSLTIDDLVGILKRALKKNEDYKNVKVTDSVLKLIASNSSGDARGALNTLENVINLTPIEKGKKTINDKNINKILDNKVFLYDKNGEEHYNLISALHKSMRNSDPDAAIYYMSRMLESGEDPLYIARRLIRFSSEDVGLANPNALLQAVACYDACHYIGVPECNVILTQCVTYLSLCPKSNSLEVAYGEASGDAKKTMDVKVPMHLRNAVTKLDEEMGNGKGYKYAHNFENHIAKMECVPEPLKNKHYYHPTEIGQEKNFKEILRRVNELKK
jgi:putative ATPase